MEAVAVVYYKSPVGLIEIKGSKQGIASVSFQGADAEGTPAAGEIPACVAACVAQLDEYFRGKRREFDLPLDLQGTDFQKKVWQELLKIGYGKTVSYLYIAEALGDCNATRAVGSANGQNKIAIIIPCHRVIGHDGKLTGYAGGLWRKKQLLELETPPRQTRLFQ